MLMLAAFVALTLLAAGLFAVLMDNTLLFAVLLVVLILAVLVVAPQATTLMAHVQHAIDATLPVALR
jgi:hypothetical protein